MQQAYAISRSLSAAAAAAARNAALALGLVLLSTIAMAAPTESCGAPADLHDGWTVAAPAQEGLNPELICAIGPRLKKLTDADPNGVVVVRHGALVYEDYLTGEDQRWQELHRGEPPRITPHDAGTLHDLQSITKSVVAILTGIAFDRGWLKDANAPVLSFFPEYAGLRTAEKDHITLRDLLSMTSGLRWPESSSSLRRLDAASEPDRFVLEHPVAATPGVEWHYSNGGVEVLGAILDKVAHRPLDQFAKKALFDPLGITDWEWGRLANGRSAASWGLRLRPRDLAKIGQLVLNQGVWHGRRIVSAAWIKQMTAAQSPPGWLFGWGGDAYGYLWWLGRASIDNREIDWVGGNGWGGQRLYVVPSLDLVVAVTAGAFKRGGLQDVAGDTALDIVLRAATGH